MLTHLFRSWTNRMNRDENHIHRDDWSGDIFSLNFAFYPANIEEHWFLLAASMQEKTIFYVDSLFNNDRASRYTLMLKEYFFGEYKHRHGNDMSQEEKNEWKITYMVCARQQENGYDCGMFTCAYAYCLLHGLSPTTVVQSDMDALRMQFIYCILQEGKAQEGKSGSSK